MHCIKSITDDVKWVGGNDRRLSLFEGVYKVPTGVSYNSYMIMDEKTVLMDTVDKSVCGIFFDNIEHLLNGRPLDYVVVQHMEPDHSATLAELLMRHPETTVVCNGKTAAMMKQFLLCDLLSCSLIVSEGDTLSTGRHTLNFVMAPMVHWPEVMVTYDKTDKILFSADAFGCFGALNGAIFADEVDFENNYMDEARRYYCNIVGKYGTQVQALLKKAASLDISIICPLHGFSWRRNIASYIGKYLLWSSYEPEEKGVLIAYASVYGHTAGVADFIACALRDRGIKTAVYDVSVTEGSEIVAAAFRYSHMIFASATYNAGIFIRMEELLRDLAAHNLRNRTVAFVQNGSWAATSGKLMREILSSCKDMTFLEQSVSITSSPSNEQLAQAEALSDAVALSISGSNEAASPVGTSLDSNALFKLSYGLFVLTARDGSKDNGCIINTAQLLTDNPKRMSVTVNKQNYTHDMIASTGRLAISVLSESAPFAVFERFGFHSGRDTDKFAADSSESRTESGLRYLNENANAVISGKVAEKIDCGTHTLFIVDITEARILSDERSMTYAYYFEHVKPKPQPPAENKKGYVCKICGYVYEGDPLPADFICPLCKHGAEDFEPLQ